MTRALADVLAERERQDAKWGEQNHDPFCYLAILVEEAGEFAQAALHSRFGGPAAVGLRVEAVHVAAVALAIVECLVRGLIAYLDAVGYPDDHPHKGEREAWDAAIEWVRDAPLMWQAVKDAAAERERRYPEVKA